MSRKNGISILIVEDEIITAMLIKKRLADLRADICGIATSGEDAIMIAESRNPELVLMDIRLSGVIDGIQAAERIVSSVLSKIIFITGYADENVRNKAGKVNPLAFMTKPVNFDSLMRIITQEFCSEKKIS